MRAFAIMTAVPGDPDDDVWWKANAAIHFVLSLMLSAACVWFLVVGPEAGQRAAGALVLPVAALMTWLFGRRAGGFRSPR